MHLRSGCLACRDETGAFLASVPPVVGAVSAHRLLGESIEPHLLRPLGRTLHPRHEATERAEDGTRGRPASAGLPLSMASSAIEQVASAEQRGSALQAGAEQSGAQEVPHGRGTLPRGGFATRPGGFPPRFDSPPMRSRTRTSISLRRESRCSGVMPVTLMSSSGDSVGTSTA